MVTDKLRVYIKTSEQKCYWNEQYSRRECLEIPGIPSCINNNDLERTILNLFSKVNSLVEPNFKNSHCFKLTYNAPTNVTVKLSKCEDVYWVLKAYLKKLTLMELEYLLATRYFKLWKKIQLIHKYKWYIILYI